jgi:3-hydroxyisobutyrate dehydrogenase-like beta-hydroxyacid dehydrogenase
MTSGEKSVANRTVGVIGLGLMGEVFSRRLIDGGQSVVGYDIDAAKGGRLADMGGRAGASIAEVARACDPILLAVFDTSQVEDVVENHVLPEVGETSRKIVLCASTCDPDRIAALGERVIARGIRFLETPVSGTSEQVRRGDGVGLIGGNRETAAEAEAVLAILFPRRFHVGRIGDGGRTKLAINLILGLNRMALAEGLVFARRLGLDPAAFLAVAKESAAYSQIMDVKGAKMIHGMLNGDFTPEGRVRQTLKDVYLMLEQAKYHGQSLPMLNVHRDVLEACVRAGEADFDNSAVINEIARRQEPTRDLDRRPDQNTVV